MDLTVSPLISYILALAGTSGFIWFLFAKAEDTLKAEKKKEIVEKTFDTGFGRSEGIDTDNILIGHGF